MSEVTYNQLQKQVELLERSNTALRFELKRQKILSSKRLNRAKRAEMKLDEMCEVAARLTREAHGG